jgi:hypothetical protein
MSHRTRSGRGPLAAIAAAVVGLAACGGTSVASPPRPTIGVVSTTPAPSLEATSSPPIVGRWMQVHTCHQLVGALEDAGLGALAPSQVGDYFPNERPAELAAKEDVCSGARPQRHYHFFTADGAFGSIDRFGQQVDDGPWTVEGDLLGIHEGAWRFEIEKTQLSLEPIISEEQIEQGLADPLEWSPAGWIVAVAYPGTTWRRVPCGGWC